MTGFGEADGQQCLYLGERRFEAQSVAEGVDGVVEFAFLKIDCAEVGVDFGYIGLEFCEFNEGCFRLIQAARGEGLLALLG